MHRSWVRESASCIVVAAAMLPGGSVRAALLSPGEFERGREVYSRQCAACHGRQGEGTEAAEAPLTGDKAIAELVTFIDATMPEGAPQDCTGEEAAGVAAYIHQAFYSPAARRQARPPTVQFARLTVRQLEQTLCDLLGSFEERPPLTADRGLEALVFGDRVTKTWSKETAVIARIDPELDLDLGESRPDGLPPREKEKAEQFSPLEYGVRWQGSVIAPETGDYEFIIKTCNGVRLWLDLVRESGKDRGLEHYDMLPPPLIDAMVPDGKDAVHRVTVRLLGGRAYPLWVEFIRFVEPTSHVRLKWKRPGHAEEVIPTRFLAPVQVPHPYVPQAAFPPDDRSEGYLRGTSISEAWQEAVTRVALETASHVARRVVALARLEEADLPEARGARIREFCERFVTIAFRRPLTDDDKKRFVTDRLAGVREDAGVRRVVMMALLSPRFLYREHGHGGFDDHAVASWLSFALWDSLPDDPLLAAAATGELNSREQIAAQVDRMLADPRTLAKLREFARDWLQLDQVAALTKDAAVYPEFDARLTSDLRTSLELFIDEVLASPDASLRRLLLDNHWYVNDRLARFYGLESPPPGGFAKVASVAADGQGRAGLLLHPFMLSRFAYVDTSSPIHRGVFIVRTILGRSLKAPPDNVEPEPPDAEQVKTTRDRVAAQTSAATCQGCHAAINGLGFTLEHFDAVGRYRKTESERPIDASGTYVDRDGRETRFANALDLAAFLADSPECRTAFADQLFHYTIKQPSDAFGANRAAELSELFVAKQLNMRLLLREIVISSAVQMKKLDSPNESTTAR